MPELPEVNTFQQYFDQHVLQQRIAKVEVADAKILRNLTADRFKQNLKGRTFSGSYRRGKYLFGTLDNGHHLLMHFGMTGDLLYYRDADQQPRHERFAFVFDNGYRLGFDCPRKFARILYLDDLDDYLTETKLGEDALRISESEFLDKMEGRKIALKSFLLNQHHLAGVGNLYADEICFQCRVHPASLVDRLTNKKRQQIYHKMREILQWAIDQKVHYKAYPEHWFWEWRQAGATGPKGLPVLHDTIAGRSTYFVKDWQKLY